MSIKEQHLNGLKRSSPQVIEEPELKKQRIDAQVDANGDTGLTFTISKVYSDIVAQLQKIYSGHLDGKDVSAFFSNQSQMISEPFKVMELKNFLHDDRVLSKLSSEISRIQLNRKNNDLYSYKVSDEMTISDKEFKPLLNFLQSDVRSFLQSITNETLNEQLSVTVSRYDKTDYLLCHDDQLEGRKIAFVLYLVDSEWSEKDGGQFEMFNCDKGDNQPLEIVKRLVPKRNAFNFFVVGPNTYHQVSEVLTDRTPRWSINGWFHADNAFIVPRNYTFPLMSSLYSPFKNSNPDYDVDYDLFTSWISSKYLIPDFQSEVRKIFILKSEIQLPEFFNVSKYNLLKKAIESAETLGLWKQYFRPAFAKFSFLPEEANAPEIIHEAIKLFRSEAFFLLLSQLTGVGLHKKAMEDLNTEPGPSTSSSAAIEDNKPELIENPICRGEIRKWQKGDYSLASNESPDFKEVWGLDVMLFFDQFTRSTVLDEVEHKETKFKVQTNDDNQEKLSEAVIKKEVENDEDDEEDEDFEISNRALYDSESEEDSEDDDDERIDGASDDDDHDNDDDYDDEMETENKHGGDIVYIDDESSEELMTFSPAENCLNIVYRLKGSQRFMKFINCTSPIEKLHEIAYVYTDGDLYNV